jgi:hypothetical protein
MNFKRIFSLIAFLMPFTLFAKTNSGSSFKADIIVYGGTSAAVTAAVEAVRSGKTVIMVSPDIHLGGLTSGGLGYTDTGNKSVIGGLSREFYHRVWLHYSKPEAWKWQKQAEFGNRGQGTVAMDGENRTMWLFEPHVALMVFEEFITENSIIVHRNEWLDRINGVTKKNNKIQRIKTLSGKTYSGKIFIDATYEGDLMAAAGVTYNVGRESGNEFNETWNGVQPDAKHHGHYFKKPIDPYKIKGKPESGLLYGISKEPIGPTGSGDKKIQAYCYRTCMSNHPENRVPFPKPSGYNPSKYELLTRVFASGWGEWFDKFDLIPNRKTDTNNHGPFSSDFIGMNYEYPEATYQRRGEIIKEHEEYQKGLLYFVTNDPSVPANVREKMQQWGLAADEFKDNGNWPHQLYIREARRMRGEYVTTENDVLARTVVPNPIGMGSYAMDSHNVQRYITSEGYVQNEGDIGIKPDKPYSVAYGSILPVKHECSNLLVPVCLSATHIAYGSIRMEPVFMILGQSAAVAASIAIDRRCAVQDIHYTDLKEKLLLRKQILTLN